MPVVEHLKQHKLLLDTHTCIWLMIGEERLSTVFLRAVEKSIKHSQIYISAISVWEVGMLVEKKRLELEMDVLDWVEQALDGPGTSLLPISPRIAIGSTRLPEGVHGDPADRILIATAHEHNAVLITHDEKILGYGKSHFVNVHDPCK